MAMDNYNSCDVVDDTPPPNIDDDNRKKPYLLRKSRLRILFELATITIIIFVSFVFFVRSE